MSYATFKVYNSSYKLEDEKCENLTFQGEQCVAMTTRERNDSKRMILRERNWLRIM